MKITLWEFLLDMIDMEENKSLVGSYITIQGWMLESLGLSGNELLVFALIYSYCRNGGGVYYGSLSLIEQWTNSTKRTAITTLQKLMEKGLIVKRIEKVYGKDNILYDLSPNISPLVKNFHQLGENIAQDGEIFSPNNINNIDNNKESTHFVRTKEKTDTSNFDLTFIRPDYANCVLEWLTHKKKIKKGYKTEAGIRKMYNALFQMSFGDASVAQMIIDQSIANNWDGLFPLKTGTATMSKTKQQEQESYEKQKRVLEMMAERERRKQDGNYGVASTITDTL